MPMVNIWIRTLFRHKGQTAVGSSQVALISDDCKIVFILYLFGRCMLRMQVIRVLERVDLRTPPYGISFFSGMCYDR